MKHFLQEVIFNFIRSCYTETFFIKIQLISKADLFLFKQKLLMKKKSTAVGKVLRFHCTSVRKKSSVQRVQEDSSFARQGLGNRQVAVKRTFLLPLKMFSYILKAVNTIMCMIKLSFSLVNGKLVFKVLVVLYFLLSSRLN